MSGRLLMNNIEPVPFKLPLYKRIFDIIISILSILILWPLFIAVACLIKLETKGAVFYKTKRVGAGYKSFVLYKFRSMKEGSDTLIHDLSHLNLYHYPKRENTSTVFIKLRDDLRTTRIGRFIRNTHIDELPQLYNVLKGDMSLVGNRPLEIYEAEQLKSRGEMLRFSAPAGITGLWQVQQHRKLALIESERISLDNFYALKQSFLFDLSILIKTIPVVLQPKKIQLLPKDSQHTYTFSSTSIKK